MEREEGPLQESPDVLRQQLTAAKLRRLSGWLDAAFRIPGTRWRVGWDVLLGLVPVAGDALSLSLSGYVIWLSRQAGAPSRLRTRMVTHVVVDFFIGLVPGIGDLLDVANRANLRNVRLLEAWLQEQEAARQRVQPESGYRAELLLALVLLVLVLGAMLAWQLLG